MKQTTLILGVDIGGSHITAALVDIHTKKILEHSRVRGQVDSSASAAEILASWTSVIRSAMGDSGVDRIGIAMPGPFDYAAGVSMISGQHKYDALFGRNVKEMLSASLKISADMLLFTNDAACFLRGEMFAGACQGASAAIGLTLGTGLGSAIFRGGEAVDANLWCAPFLDGIAEDYLSTRWFVKRYAQLTGQTVSGARELIERAGDRVREQVFREFGTNLAAFLKQAFILNQTEAVVLGGNISRAYPFFAGHLQRQLEGCSVVRTVLGEDAGLLGAASNWVVSPAAGGLH